MGVLILLGALGVSACSSTAASVVDDDIKNDEITRAVYIRTGADELLAVLANGEVIALQNGEGSAAIYSGCTTDQLQVKVQASGEKTAVAGYPFTMGNALPVYSDYAEAPEAFAKVLLDNLIANGQPDAITSYKLHRVELVEAGGEGKQTIHMEFDVQPFRYSYLWGSPGDDGLVRQCSATFSIYGADNLWFGMDPIYMNEVALNELAGIEPIKAVSSEILLPSEHQTVLFVSDAFTYYEEKTLLPYNEIDLTQEGIQEYETVLWCIANADGEKRSLRAAARNTDYSFADYWDGNLYLKTQSWLPFSESHNGPIIHVNERAQSAKVVWRENGDRWLAAVQSTAYFLSSEGQSDGLYALELVTGGVSKISDLPEVAAESNYLSVLHIIDGKMRIMYRGEQLNSYDIDLRSGEVSVL